MIGFLKRLIKVRSSTEMPAVDPVQTEIAALRGFAGKSAARASLDEMRNGVIGDRAMFTYTDRDGNVTSRHITGWRSDGAYIRGKCSTWKVERTFRKDRIQKWTVF